MAGHLTSNFITRAEDLTNSDFKSSNARDYLGSKGANVEVSPAELILHNIYVFYNGTSANRYGVNYKLDLSLSPQRLRERERERERERDRVRGGPCMVRKKFHLSRAVTFLFPMASVIRYIHCYRALTLKTPENLSGRERT